MIRGRFLSKSIFAGLLFYSFFNPVPALRSADKPKIITNPDRPLYGTLTFDLKKDLEINDEDVKTKEIYGFGHIVISSKGDIYASDSHLYRVNVFDNSGRFIMALGRKGQGPGEFNEIRSLAIDVKDNLYVSDAGFRLHVFDGNGKFVRMITINGAANSGLFSFGVGTEGQILSEVQSYRRPSGLAGPVKITHSIDLLSEDGQFQRSVATFESETPGLLKTERGYTQPNNFCDPTLRFKPILPDVFVYGFSSEYVLYIVNSDGNPQKLIKLERKPSALSKREKDQIVENFRRASAKRTSVLARINKEDFRFPRYKPLFRQIISDDKGRMYVERFLLPFETKTQSRFDVFDSMGRYIYDLTLPSNSPVLHNGRIYLRETDSETGSTKLVRYIITNWSQLKS